MIIKDPLRFTRYREKMNYISEMIEDLPDTSEDKLVKRGIYYSIQTAIESLIDLIAMVVKDLGCEVKDDYSNIELVADRLKLGKEIIEKTQKANGLRNVLVHRYNGVDDKIFRSSLEDVKQLLIDWLDALEEFIKK